MAAQGLPWLAILENVSAIISDVVTTIALIIGGIFAWWRWGREKPQSSRGNLSHEVFLAEFDQNRLILHVALTLENAGNVPLIPCSGQTAVLKVSPLDSDVKTVLDRSNPFAPDQTELDWPELERRNYDGKVLGLWLDSNETERLYCDFLLSKENKVIAVRSELSMEEDTPGTIWPVVTFVNIDEMLQGNAPTKIEAKQTIEHKKK